MLNYRTYTDSSLYLCIIFWTGKTRVGPVIQHMWDQEKEHKAKFEELIPRYRVRPTVLVPLWNVAGFALGAGECSQNYVTLNQYITIS